MAQHIDKALVTNMVALKAKYGSGLKDIKAAIKRLITADKARGLTTKLIDIASSAEMKKHKGKKVADANDPKQNKSAIDKVYAALTPDYIVLLGSVDVIPHQDLANPVYDPSPDGDHDLTADSDLPYACEHAYSQKIEDFTAPTRVVGRLPDLTGGSDPAYLVGLLDVAATYTSLAKDEFTDYLGITALVWQGSTKESLKNVFGSAADMKKSPSDGPSWTAAQLKVRSHFINCHGAQIDPKFYGQKGESFPEAHDAAHIDGKITEGTVASVECCYGAELYDPAGAAGQAGICNTYLANRAYAYFGSSTIAYGPADGNGAADWITQFFLKHVLSGASTGRAVLQARQDYLIKNPVLDPIDLKTFAQFSLMGDPAVHPVLRPTPMHVVPKSKAMKGLADAFVGVVAGRSSRRKSLLRTGIALAAAAVASLSDHKKPTGAAMKQLVADALAEVDAKLISVASYALGGAPGAPTSMKALAKIAAPAASITVAIGKMPGGGPPPRLCAVVAREHDGAIAVRRLYSR